MTINEIIERLLSLPKEAKDKQIWLQIETNQYSYTGPITEMKCVVQNQYTNDETGSWINQDQYNKLLDSEPNDLYMVKKDFYLVYPAYNTFLISDSTTPEADKTKEDLIKESIAEGNIPHLRIERD